MVWLRKFQVTGDLCPQVLVEVLAGVHDTSPSSQSGDDRLKLYCLRSRADDHHDVVDLDRRRRQWVPFVGGLEGPQDRCCWGDEVRCL